MRNLIALLLLVISPSTFAASTQDFECYDLRNRVNRNGILLLDGIRYIADPAHGSYADPTDVVTVWVKTKDFNACPLYTSLTSDPNQSLTSD